MCGVFFNGVVNHWTTQERGLAVSWVWVSLQDNSCREKLREISSGLSSPQPEQWGWLHPLCEGLWTHPGSCGADEEMLIHWFVFSELMETNGSWGAEPKNPQAGMMLTPEEENKWGEGPPAATPALSTNPSSTGMHHPRCPVSDAPVWQDLTQERRHFRTDYFPPQQISNRVWMFVDRKIFTSFMYSWVASPWIQISHHLFNLENKVINTREFWLLGRICCYS